MDSTDSVAGSDTRGGHIHRPDLHDDRRDVVESAAAIRFGNQRVDNSTGAGSCEEQLLQTSVVDHAGEPVACDEENVAGNHLAAVDIGFDGFPCSNTARDDIAAVMIARLFWRQQASVHLLLRKDD